MRTSRTQAWLAIAVAALAGVASPTLLPAKDNSAALELARQLNQAFTEVADQVSPAVVVISVARKPQSFALELDDEDNPLWKLVPELRKKFEEWRERQKQPQKDNKLPFGHPPLFDGQGSGLVIREEGYILTNEHVVDGAEKIKVRFKDSAEEFEAEVRGVDAQSDVAVLKINPKGRKLAVARLGDSDKTRVGEFAIAIGAPFELDYSVTFGHVSAKGRSRIVGDPIMDQDFIQTDANINPGNSGGPLVNISGEVIGLTTLIHGLNTGIGFAIPINLAREVADHLIAEGKFVRSYLGVVIEALKDHPDYQAVFPNVADGVVIKQIPPDGPAAKSELRPSDVVTAVDGKPVATPQQLRNEIRSKKVGQSVSLDVSRSGKNIKVKVLTGAWPDRPTPVVGQLETPPEDKSRTLGLAVQPMTSELAEQFGVDKSEGVIITEVEKGSVAERKGLRPGDIITEVNRKSVSTPKQFREAVKAGDLKKGIILNYTRGGTSTFEILKESGD